MKEQTKHPGPPKSSPKVYMTPQLAKRKDGLCPSLMQKVEKKEKLGYVTKPYQTNSGLLLQVKEKEGVPKEITELQTLVESLNKALKSAVKPDQGIAGVTFKPEGCVWKVMFDPSLNGAASSYKIEVVCSANSAGGNSTNYLIDTVLVPRVTVDPNPLAPPLDGFKEAKEVFDAIALKVRKSIVRLEFPSFPEGCKGVAFRDVYQLNARVSAGPRLGSMYVTQHLLQVTVFLTVLISNSLIPSLSLVRLRLCAVEHTEPLGARSPLSAFFARICRPRTMPRSTTKLPS